MQKLTLMAALDRKPWIHRQLLLFCAWIVVVFLDEHLIHKLFLSNIVAVGLFIVSGILLLTKPFKESFSILLITGLMIFAVLCSYLQFGLQPNYLEEFSKTVLIIIGGMMLGKLYSTEQFEYILKPFPIVFGCYVFLQAAIIGTPDYNDLRFDLYSYGNPNTLAFLMSICIVILLYCYRVSSVWKWLFIIFFSIILMRTYSRSAVFGLTGGLLFAFTFRRKKPFSIREVTACIVLLLLLLWFFILYLYGNAIDHLPSPTLLGYYYHPHFPHYHRFAIYNIGRFSLADIQKTHLSGRLVVWSAILKTIAQHPAAWLTGFGPGLVPKLNLLRMHYPTIDSLILKCFYSYGLIGLGISCWFCLKLVTAQAISNRYQILKNILGFFMVFTLVANDTTSASQALLYGMLVVGFIFSKQMITSK